jgi:superkiller protein 3
MDAARTAFVEAVTIDPEFADAYNELGAADSDLRRLPEAADDFQKAIDLVPDHRLALPNLSIVLAKLSRFHDAAAVARRALKVVAGATAARIHYVLAASLLADHGDFDEIILHFERSVDAVPTARITAADLLAARGRSQDAVRELEQYLQDAPAGDANRPKAEARLAQLRH